MAEINVWENANLNEFPIIEFDGEEFAYAVQDGKIDIQDYGLNNIKTKKLSTGAVAVSEETNTNSAKIGIPVYQTPSVRKWIVDRRNEGLFTITLNYTKAGYVEKIINATIENVVTGQGGDTFTMVIVGSIIDVQRT